MLHFYVPTGKYKKLREQSHQKKIKYLGINLPKEVKDVYSENLRHWWKKLTKTPTDGKIHCVLRLEESTLFNGVTAFDDVMQQTDGWTKIWSQLLFMPSPVFMISSDVTEVMWLRLLKLPRAEGPLSALKRVRRKE